MNPLIVGLPAFIGGAFFGYLLREFSVGKLTAEQVGTLSVNMRPTRLGFLYSVLSALSIFIIARFAIPSLQHLWFLVFLAAVALLTVSFEVIGWRRSQVNGYPSAFVRPYLLSRVITISGTLVLTSAMAATVFAPRP